MILTLAVLMLTVLMFIVGRIRSDVVALCALAVLLVSGVLTPEEALSGFSSTVVIIMVGLFVISGAIIQTGLAREMSKRIMFLSKGSETLTFIFVILTTSFIGAFVSNTGTVALMMPIVVSMTTQLGKSPSRLLMPLAFASSMGGMLTLIGTPPNLIINDSLTTAGYKSLSFFSFLPMGTITVAIGIIVLLPLSKYLLDKKTKNTSQTYRGRKSLEELVREYSLRDNMRTYRILDSSEIRGKSVAEIDLSHRYGLSILEIRRVEHSKSIARRRIHQQVATAGSTLHVGDIIYLTGKKESFSRFESEVHLRQIETTGMDFYDIGMAEIVVMPNSKMEGSQIRETNFRDQYNINIVGVKRHDDYITTRVAEEVLHVGDVLLVQGSWRNISKLDSGGDWVVLGQPAELAGKVILDYKAPLAAVILVCMICAMVFDFIPIAPVTAVIVAALLMVLTGCLRSVEEAYRTINWESIVLIATMMPMSIALEKTGTSSLVSHSLVSSLGHIGPTALLAGIYFTTSLMTMFISNTATAVLMAPIALTSAQEVGVSPYPMLFAVTLGASMCFASPFSTPPNVLVMRAGNYKFMDYVKVGLPLQIIIGVVMTFVLPLLFPF